MKRGLNLLRQSLVLLISLTITAGNISAQEDLKPVSEFTGPLKLHQTGIERDKSSFLFRTSEGWSMKISFLNSSMVRVQLAPASGFEASLTERFGFVRTDWKEVRVKMEEQPAYTILQTDSMMVKVYKEDLILSFLDGQGNEINSERAARSWNAEGGGCLRFTMPEDEHFFGLGFQRRTIDCRGKIFPYKREHRSENATVPFFLSSRGYGFLSNNTWDQVFDFQSHASGYDITAVDGQLDYYFITGAEFPDILNNYIRLTGAPQIIPRWGLGLFYICRYYEEQQGVLDIARSFRKHDIPCDMISLEPGWEDYSYSNKWIWSPERFPDPEGMIKELNSLGFQFGLWESGTAPRTGYADEALRKNWYAQRVKTSVDIGVTFFKQDDPYPRMIDFREMNEPKFINEEEFIKFRFDKALSNLSNTLYIETAMDEFRRITGKRTFMLFNSYFASFATHRWPSGWAGDSGAGMGLLNAGLAAHSMVSLDMTASSLPEIHRGYLNPLALIDSWAGYYDPWLFPAYMTEVHRAYSKLRYRLVPYLYSTQAQSHFTGMPMMRAMVLQFQSDSATWKLGRQHMLGDALLAGLEPSIYLPEGEWVDYWNGERIESRGQWVTRTLEGYKGGTLFVRSGSIIPMQSVTSNLQSEQPVLITLDLFPGKDKGSGRLYEDDGTTFAYEKGEYAATEFSSHSSEKGFTITAEPRSGTYTGMPERVYLLQVHNVKDIKSVVCNSRQLKEIPTRESLLYKTGKAGFWYDANKHTLFIKPGSSWRLGYDSRGKKGDPDRDSLYISAGFRSEENGFTCTIETDFTNEPDITIKNTKVVKPDRLTVLANNPERILLPDSGTWLKRRTIIFVSLYRGEKHADNASNKILLEVFDENGNLLRRKEKDAINGEARFDNEPYVEEETRFRVSSPGLSPVEVFVRKSPEMHGNK